MIRIARLLEQGLDAGADPTSPARIVSIEVDDGVLRVIALGPPPELEPQGLRAELDLAGIDLDLVVDLVVGGTRTIPAR